MDFNWKNMNMLVFEPEVGHRRTILNYPVTQVVLLYMLIRMKTRDTIGNRSNQMTNPIVCVANLSVLSAT